MTHARCGHALVRWAMLFGALAAAYCLSPAATASDCEGAWEDTTSCPATRLLGNLCDGGMEHRMANLLTGVAYWGWTLDHFDEPHPNPAEFCQAHFVKLYVCDSLGRRRVVHAWVAEGCWSSFDSWASGCWDAACPSGCHKVFQLHPTGDCSQMALSFNEPGSCVWALSRGATEVPCDFPQLTCDCWEETDTPHGCGDACVCVPMSNGDLAGCPCNSTAICSPCIVAPPAP